MELAIKVKLLNLFKGKLPSKTHNTDAGWDLFASERVELRKGEICVVKTGIALEIPVGWYGQIVGRSGLATRGVAVLGGVIDSSYRGEVLVVLISLEEEKVILRMHDRIAQLVFHIVPVVGFEIVDKLSETIRGDKGFGSSGN